MGTNRSVMNSELYPVILVHGWNSHPGIWNRHLPRLSEESIPFWKFDHTTKNGADLSELAAAREASAGEMRGTGMQDQLTWPVTRLAPV